MVSEGWCLSARLCLCLLFRFIFISRDRVLIRYYISYHEQALKISTLAAGQVVP